MAHFYGTIQGQRGPGASRLGSKESGLQVTAASWQGAVSVYLSTEDGVDHAHVVLEPWHGKGVSRVLYSGPVSGAKPPRRTRRGPSGILKTLAKLRDTGRVMTEAEIDAAVTAAEIRAEEPPRFEQGERYAR